MEAKNETTITVFIDHMARWGWQFILLEAQCTSHKLQVFQDNIIVKKKEVSCQNSANWLREARKCLEMILVYSTQLNMPVMRRNWNQSILCQHLTQ